MKYWILYLIFKCSYETNNLYDHFLILVKYSNFLFNIEFFYFLWKKIIQCGDGDEAGYPNPSGMGMKLNFSSPLGMGRATGKYMRIGHSFKTRLGHRLGRGTESLGQWSNHWVIGRTAWLNRNHSDDSVRWLGLRLNLYSYLTGLNRIESDWLGHFKN